MSLPHPQHLGRSDWRAFGVCLASFGIYPLINWLVRRRARPIPITWIDRRMPCWPWTTAVYVSLYPLLVGHALWLLRYPPWLRRMLAAVTGANVLAGAIFLIIPTSVPRPSVVQGHGAWLLQRLWAIDPPNNACPSLHTTYAVLIAWLHLRMHSRQRWGFLAWALAIVASTLTTRQHRLLDLLGGTGVAYVVVKQHSLCQFAKAMV